MGLWVVVPSGLEMDVHMSWSPRLVRSVMSDDRVPVRLGHKVVDDYLEFVAARCRPNTVLAAGFDLKVRPAPHQYNTQPRRTGQIGAET